ncbi:hypothetical protein NQ317_001560, partial [Molorchus minor]
VLNGGKMMEFTCFFVLTIILGVLLLIYLKNYVRAVFLAFTLKTPPSWPLLGHVLLINDYKKMEEIATNASQLFGPMTNAWISIVPFFIIYEPRHLKVILAGKNSKKNIFYKILHNFIGNGLITNNGLKWKMHRRLIQSLFHNNVLDIYVPKFLEHADILLNKLEGKTKVKITSYINDCVLDILHETVLGIPLGTDQVSPFRNGAVMLIQRVSRPWLLLEMIFKYTSNAENEMKQKGKLVVLQKRYGIRKSQTRCLLDSLIEISENNPDFTDDDIINESITFMLAGQDSVGSAIAFCLFFIAQNSEVQNKVLQEVDNIFDNNPKLAINDLGNMKYLEQCIKESLRLAPSVPIISRVVTEDIILDNKTIPSGTNILVSPFVTHRLPHYFPDPLKFNPERFSTENIEKMHPYAFIPFSIGQRNCIGNKFAILEMKAIISTILRHYSISLPPGHESPQFSYRVTLRAKGGIYLRLHRR